MKVSAAGDLPDLEHVVVMDFGLRSGGADSFGDLMANAAGMPPRDAGFDAWRRRWGRTIWRRLFIRQGPRASRRA